MFVLHPHSNSNLILQVEDLKEQLGARADSEYALQEENRRLQVKRNLGRNWERNLKTNLERNLERNLNVKIPGGGDEREL